MRFCSGAVRSLVLIGATALLLLLGVPNAAATQDPLWVRQYGPTQIGAVTAWQKTMGKGVKVSVVDNGIDVEHPDLKPNLDLAGSYDWVCDDPNPDDDSREPGHGTHVAGTIGAVANNGLGVAGVAPEVQLMGQKVSYGEDPCDTGSPLALTQVARAITHSVDRGAKVINLSLDELINIPGLTDTLTQSCNQAFNRGSLCVVAAGNSGQTKSSGYPYDFNALVVTANDSTGAHAGFGQKADTKWAVSAPGVDIMSTWPLQDTSKNGYNSIQGTSMAAPHASGAAALLFAAGMNNRQVAETLVKTAGPARDSTVEGAGIIHVDRALGLETTSTTVGPRTGAGQGTVTRGGRTGAAGGAGAIAPTTTTTPGRTDIPGVEFEEGIATGDNFDDIRLREASRNSANKPFNVTGPLIVISVVSGVLLTAAAIPRLRSKDTPLT